MAHGMFLNSTITISLGKSFFIYAVQIHLNKEAFHQYGNWGVCFTYCTWFAGSDKQEATKCHNKYK